MEQLFCSFAYDLKCEEVAPCRLGNGAGYLILKLTTEKNGIKSPNLRVRLPILRKLLSKIITREMK